MHGGAFVRTQLRVSHSPIGTPKKQNKLSLLRRGLRLGVRSRSAPTGTRLNGRHMCCCNGLHSFGAGIHWALIHTTTARMSASNTAFSIPGILADIEGGLGGVIEAGVEQACLVVQQRDFRERHLHLVPVNLAGADKSLIRLDRHTGRVDRLAPFYCRGHLRVYLADQVSDARKRRPAPLRFWRRPAQWQDQRPWQPHPGSQRFGRAASQAARHQGGTEVTASV